MTAGRKWTENEIVQAISLYIKTPFGKIHSRNPEIVILAEMLNRTPGSIAMKMSNLASIDETLDRKGMSNSSELDRAVWSKFFNSLVESAKFLPDVNKTETAQGFAEDAQARFENLNTSGENILRITNTRQGQNIFREMVLASYDEKCAITGISQPSLLIAGHIRPWSFDKENRMNPRNGICLNRLHDKAFENNLIAVEDDGRIVYSTALDPVTTNKMRLMSMTGYFNFPSKFRPDENFLREHRR